MKGRTGLKLKKVLTRPLHDGLSMPKERLNPRIEFAMHTGYVITVEPEDLEYTVRYIATVMTNCEVLTGEIEDYVDRAMTKLKGKDVRMYCINTLEDMLVMAFLINEPGYSELPDDPCDLTHVKEYRMGSSAYWYSWCYNMTMPDFSELGDIFVEDAGAGFIHRVS